MSEVSKYRSFNDFLFAPPKRSYTLDTFRRKHLIWIPQESRSTPLPCLFLSPRKPLNKRVKKKFKTKNIPIAPPVPDCIDNIICQVERGEFIMIYANSNTMDLASSYEFVKRISKKLRIYVICFEYTGYGFAVNSKGEQIKPTEQSTKQDIKETYNFVRNILNWPSERIIIYGESIGCGVACYCASFVQKQYNDKIGGLILRSAFTSFEDLIKATYGKVGNLITNKFNNKKYLRDVKSPLLIIHGELDNQIPLKLATSLMNTYKGHFLRTIHVAQGETDHMFENQNIILPMANFLKDILKANEILEEKIPSVPNLDAIPRILHPYHAIPTEFMKATMPDPISKAIREKTAQTFNTIEGVKLQNEKSFVSDDDCRPLISDKKIEKYLIQRITKFCRALAANYYSKIHALDDQILQPIKEQKKQQRKLSKTSDSDHSSRSSSFDSKRKSSGNFLKRKSSKSSNSSITSMEINKFLSELTFVDNSSSDPTFLDENDTNLRSNSSFDDFLALQDSQNEKKKLTSSSQDNVGRKREKINKKVNVNISSSSDNIKKRKKKKIVNEIELEKKQLNHWVEGQFWFYNPLLDCYMEIEQLLGYYGPNPVPHVLGASFKAIGSAPYGLLHLQARIGGFLYNWDQISRAAPVETNFRHVYNILKTRCRIPLYLCPVPSEFFQILSNWLLYSIKPFIDLPFGKFLEKLETFIHDPVPDLIHCSLPIVIGKEFHLLKLKKRMKFWGDIVLKWERENYYHASVTNCQDYFILNCAALQFKIPGESNKDVLREAVNSFPNDSSYKDFLFKKSPFSAEMDDHVDKIYKGKRVMGPKFKDVFEFIEIYKEGPIDIPDYVIMAAQWYLQICPSEYEVLCSILTRACRKFLKKYRKCSRNVK